MQVSDLGLALLASLTNLESLNISRCGMVSDSGLQLIRYLTNLQALNLHGCRQLADEALISIADLSQLTVSAPQHPPPLLHLWQTQKQCGLAATFTFSGIPCGSSLAT